MNLSIGEKILILRRRKNVSQHVLAKALNVNISVIPKYENNTYKPSYSVLVKIATYFNVSADELLQEKTP